MEAVFVHSIPHSGTMFVFEHLLQDFARARNFPIINKGERWFRHFNETGPLPKGDFITVVPMREPEEIRKSWERRQMNLDELDKLLDHVSSLKDVFILQIDSYNRDEQLKNLSTLIDYPLSTDWRRINNMPKETYVRY